MKLQYDDYGNPWLWFKHGTSSLPLYHLQWENVNQLSSIKDLGTNKIYTYKYNNQGIRTEKVVNGVTHKYYLNGEQIVAEKIGNNLVTYYYDTSGICGLNYNETDYYYVKNIFGDIIGIYDGSGECYAAYSYDAWGKCSIATNVDNIATINPFRYRGYYFDTETNLYYLNSRYYDPEIGRFVSPDSTDYLELESINGLNLYAYCANNPVMNVDPSGNFTISTFLISLTIGLLISWSLSEILGAQIAGGISSAANGGTAISTGISLCAFGSWGIVAGIALIAIGVGTIAFGVNEIVAGATGTNYIQQWTGMSDSLYNGLYIGLNIASSVGSIAGNIGMKYASTAKLNAVMKSPELIQNYSRFQFKTYARYSNQWKLLPSKNGKGMRALSLANRGNSIRYGYGINNAEHYFGAYYWIVANGVGKYRFPFI